MGESTTHKIVNIGCAAIMKDNNVLLVKRIKSPYVGYWSMPGGKIEFGEYPEEATLREIKEETNLDCKSEGLKCIASEIIHNKNEKVAQFMLYVYRLKPINDDLISTEGELKWFNLDDLDDPKIVPSDTLMIREFILKENKSRFHKIKMIEENGTYRVEEFTA